MYILVYIIFYERNIHFLKFLWLCWHQSVIYIQRSVRRLLCEDPFISLKIKPYSKRQHPWLVVTLKGRVFWNMCIYPFAQILIASLLQKGSKQGWLLGYSFSFWGDARCTVESWLGLLACAMAMTCVLCAPFQEGKAVVKMPSPLTSALWLKDVVQQLWVCKMLHTESFPWLL